MAFLQISLIIILILSALYLLSHLVSLAAPLRGLGPEKFSAYECGFEPATSGTKIKYTIIYWIIAILYLIFDLELIFIFPLIGSWSTDSSAILIYYIFFIILTIGFLYEWKQGKIHIGAWASSAP